MRNFLPLFALLFLLVSACQNQTTSEDMPSEDKQEMNKKYTLTPFDRSQAYPDATMESMDFTDGKFSFAFSNYKLRMQTPDAAAKMCANSDQGQHIHLIVDTQPYAAKYDATFDYEIEDGDHHVLAFLSRSYHESIKNGKAFIAQKVTVADQSFTQTEDITEPVLFYSRPKGNYVGKANTEKVMLDFFLVNADLGDDYQVKVMINDEEHIVDTWQPYYIEGLPMGENLITLTLLDGEGKKADTPLNPVSRKFTLQEDPAESAQ